MHLEFLLGWVGILLSHQMHNSGGSCQELRKSECFLQHCSGYCAHLKVNHKSWDVGFVVKWLYPWQILEKNHSPFSYLSNCALTCVCSHVHRKASILLQQWVENKIVPNWLHMWESVLWVDACTVVPPFYPHPFPSPPSALLHQLILQRCLFSPSLYPSFSLHLSLLLFVVKGRPPVSGVPWRRFPQA